MDKDSDSTGQVNSKQELHWEMERTRQSMSETLSEIEGEISHTLDWRTYLKRYPGAFLIGAGAMGFIIGRTIAGPGHSLNARRVHERAASFDGDDGDRSSFSENSSMRRVIDMTASALLAQVVPIVSSKLRNLLGIHAVGGGGGKP